MTQKQKEQISAPAVELVNDDSDAGILGLLNSAFDDVQRAGDARRDQAFWDWKYRSSPFGKAIVQAIRIDNQPAAAGCLWPINLRWQGRDLRALQACDTAVNPEFRRRGLFSTLNKERQSCAREQNVDLIFNFPNANSLPGYLKAGWQFVGRVPWLVRIMRPISIVSDRMHGGKARMMRVPESCRLKPSIAEILKCGVVDEEEEGVSLSRPAFYWRWRFCQHPSRDYGVVRSSADVNDFAVFTLSRKDSGLVEMVIVDFICRRNSLADLLDSLLRCARQVEAGFIAMMKPKGFPPLSFYRHGFIPKREKNLVYWPVQPSLSPEIGDIKNWNFRAAMHDSI